MRYAVPQFIDAEDKILGPLTTRQFVTMLSVVGIIFVTYKLADFLLFCFLGLAEFAIGGIFGTRRPMISN
jgi:hypothetical protein